MKPDPILEAAVDKDRLSYESLECLGKTQVWHDQWAVATFTCDHGTFEGVADGVNYTEALTRAATAFREYHEANVGYDEDGCPRCLDGERVHIKRGRD